MHLLLLGSPWIRLPPSPAAGGAASRRPLLLPATVATTAGPGRPSALPTPSEVLPSSWSLSILTLLPGGAPTSASLPARVRAAPREHARRPAAGSRYLRRSGSERRGWPAQTAALGVPAPRRLIRGRRVARPGGGRGAGRGAVLPYPPRPRVAPSGRGAPHPRDRAVLGVPLAIVGQKVAETEARTAEVVAQVPGWAVALRSPLSGSHFRGLEPPALEPR